MGRLAILFIATLLMACGSKRDEYTYVVYDGDGRVIMRDTFQPGPNYQIGQKLFVNDHRNQFRNRVFRDTGYFEEGGIRQIVSMRGEILTGWTQQFFRNGKISAERYYYEGLPLGGWAIYDSLTETPKRYDFRDAEGDILYTMDYTDSEKNRLEMVKKNTFFYRVVSSFDNVKDDLHPELLFYLPNPPNYDYRYYLVDINQQYKDEKVLATFDDSRPFAFIALYQLPDFEKIRSRLALKVITYVPNDSVPQTMYKRLGL